MVARRALVNAADDQIRHATIQPHAHMMRHHGGEHGRVWLVHLLHAENDLLRRARNLHGDVIRHTQFNAEV